MPPRFAHLPEELVLRAAPSFLHLSGARLLRFASPPNAFDEHPHRLYSLLVEDAVQLQRQEAKHLAQRFRVEFRQQLVDRALLDSTWNERVNCLI